MLATADTHFDHLVDLADDHDRSPLLPPPLPCSCTPPLAPATDIIPSTTPSNCFSTSHLIHQPSLYLHSTPLYDAKGKQYSTIATRLILDSYYDCAVRHATFDDLLSVLSLHESMVEVNEGKVEKIIIAKEVSEVAGNAMESHSEMEAAIEEGPAPSSSLHSEQLATHSSNSAPSDHQASITVSKDYTAGEVPPTTVDDTSSCEELPSLEESPPTEEGPRPSQCLYPTPSPSPVPYSPPSENVEPPPVQAPPQNTDEIEIESPSQTPAPPTTTDPTPSCPNLNSTPAPAPKRMRTHFHRLKPKPKPVVSEPMEVDEQSTPAPPSPTSNPKRPANLNDDDTPARVLKRPFRPPSMVSKPAELKTKPNPSPILSSKPAQPLPLPQPKPKPQATPSARFKPPRKSTSSTNPDAALISSLETRLRTLKQAVKYLNPEEDSRLTSLVNVWRGAGREVADRLFTLLPPPEEGTFHGGGGGSGFDNWGWEGKDEEDDVPDESGGNDDMDLDLDLDLSEALRFAESRGGYERDEGYEGYDEGHGCAGRKVRKWDKGEMLARLGVDPLLLGWNEEDEDWDEEE